MKTADDCRYLLSTILHPRLSAPGAVCVFNNRSGLALVQLMSSVRASARRLTATSTSNQMTTHRYQYASAPSDRARWGSQSKANADVRLRRPRPPHAGERQQSYKGNDVRRRVYARGRHRDGDSPFAMHAPFESRVLTRQCRALSERNFKVNHAHRAPTERVRRYVGRLSGPDNGVVLFKTCRSVFCPWHCQWQCAILSSSLRLSPPKPSAPCVRELKLEHHIGAMAWTILLSLTETPSHAIRTW